MDGANTFEKLVAELSLGERRELLKRLEAQAPLSPAPLFRVDSVPAGVEIERRYRECPWYRKVYLRVLGIFQGKSPLRVLEDATIARIGQAIEARAPGLFDHRHSLLLAPFRDELTALKESARFFYDALEGSVGRDKGAFFAFLGSLEFDYLHRRLTTEADPYAIAAVDSGATEQEVKQAAAKALESVLEAIDEGQRAVMYRNVRSLFCLKELSSFLFDRALSSFSGPSDSQSSSCPAYLLQDQLAALNDILFSLDLPPTMALLESVFVFDLQDRAGTEGFDLVAETRALLSRAEEALSAIRQFNQRVPLTAVIRCAGRDLAYLPRAITGGEDWFAVYRDHWRKRIDERFSSFVRERRREQLSVSLAEYLKGKSLRPLENAASASRDDGIPIRSAFSLAFLASFHRLIFSDEVNKALKPVLIDGEFYKRENRAEFTEAYNELLKLGETIEAFDRKLGKEGEYGIRYAMARAEVAALPVKRRKTQQVEQEADAEGSAILARASRALRSLMNVLGGVLLGDSGGRYDALSNMASLSGRSGAFISSLRNALQKIEKALQLLGEIDSVEIGR